DIFEQRDAARGPELLEFVAGLRRLAGGGGELRDLHTVGSARAGPLRAAHVGCGVLERLCLRTEGAVHVWIVGAAALARSVDDVALRALLDQQRCPAAAAVGCG